MHLNCVIVVISRESGHNNNTVPVLKWLCVCTSILPSAAELSNLFVTGIQLLLTIITFAQHWFDDIHSCPTHRVNIKTMSIALPHVSLRYGFRHLPL